MVGPKTRPQYSFSLLKTVDPSRLLPLPDKVTENVCVEFADEVVMVVEEDEDEDEEQDEEEVVVAEEEEEVVVLDELLVVEDVDVFDEVVLEIVL